MGEKKVVNGNILFTFEERMQIYTLIRQKLDEGIGINKAAKSIVKEVDFAKVSHFNTLKNIYYKIASKIASGNFQEYKDYIIAKTNAERNQFSNAIFIPEAPPVHEALEKHCEEVGIPIESVSHYWHKSQDFSIFSKKRQEVDFLNEIDRIVQKHLQINPDFAPYEINNKSKVENKDKAYKLVLSDMHVGLDPNPKGSSLYDFKYDKDVFKRNLGHTFKSLMKEYEQHGKVDSLFIYDLGDALDGWNGETTRGGHKLDQNLDNFGQFTTYVEGKLSLINMILGADIADKIYVKNVTNCNHSGSFGAIANWTIAKILGESYKDNKFEFHIMQRFMEHFVYGNHCFILTHGKDHTYMKRGLPLKLDDRTKSFIRQYIDRYRINSKYIHVEKGDLHQVGYDKTSAFDYRNYMSFAPPSAWVQHNFGASYCGYSIQVLNKNTSEISHTDYFFDEI